MAQFVKGGPDLPPEVLQAQEEGELVLFCGAGISAPAGLPLFGEVAGRKLACARRLLPAGRPTRLRIVVGHDPRGDFELVVKAAGTELLRTPVSRQTATNLWLEREIDLAAFSGKTVKLELVNQPSGWSYEAAYWAEIRLVSE